MRYVLIFIFVACVVMAFIFAGYFPGLLADYPMLQEANRSVRAWMGMDSPRSSRLSDRWLKETEQILRGASPAKKEVSEQDLDEYRE